MNDANEVEWGSRPEVIRRILEGRIMGGELTPGQLIGRKAELQQSFGVASPTIDQALKLLENDGLIVLRRGPGGGVFVASSRPVLRLGSKNLWARNARGLAENIEVREALGSLLGISAARSKNRDPNLLAELRAISAEVRSEISLTDIQNAVWRGHRILTKLSDNDTLAQFYGNLIDIAEALVLVVDWPVDGEEREAEQHRVAAHARLFDAVIVGDVADAQTWGDIVRTVSPLGRDGQLVSINDGEPDRWDNLMAADES